MKLLDKRVLNSKTKEYDGVVHEMSTNLDGCSFHLMRPPYRGRYRYTKPCEKVMKVHNDLSSSLLPLSYSITIIIFPTLLNCG